MAGVESIELRGSSGNQTREKNRHTLKQESDEIDVRINQEKEEMIKQRMRKRINEERKRKKRRDGDGDVRREKGREGEENRWKS